MEMLFTKKILQQLLMEEMKYHGIEELQDGGVRGCLGKRDTVEKESGVKVAAVASEHETDQGLTIDRRDVRAYLTRKIYDQIKKTSPPQEQTDSHGDKKCEVEIVGKAFRNLGLSRLRTEGEQKLLRKKYNHSENITCVLNSDPEAYLGGPTQGGHHEEVKTALTKSRSNVQGFKQVEDETQKHFQIVMTHEGDIHRDKSRYISRPDLRETLDTPRKNKCYQKFKSMEEIVKRPSTVHDMYTLTSSSSVPMHEASPYTNGHYPIKKRKYGKEIVSDPQEDVTCCKVEALAGSDDIQMYVRHHEKDPTTLDPDDIKPLTFLQHPKIRMKRLSDVLRDSEKFELHSLDHEPFDTLLIPQHQSKRPDPWDTLLILEKKLPPDTDVHVLDEDLNLAHKPLIQKKITGSEAECSAARNLDALQLIDEVPIGALEKYKSIAAAAGAKNNEGFDGDADAGLHNRNNCITNTGSIGIPTPGKSNKVSANHETSDPRADVASSSGTVVDDFNGPKVEADVTGSKLSARSAAFDRDMLSNVPAGSTPCFDVTINPRALTDVISNPSSKIIYWSDKTGGFTKSDHAGSNNTKKLMQLVQETKRPYPHYMKGSLLQQIRRAKQNTNEEGKAEIGNMPPKRRWQTQARWKSQDDCEEESSTTCLHSASRLNIESEM